MSQTGEGEVTVLLRQWREQDPSALHRLMPLVYEQLRQIATGYLRREKPGHTLQATALVNELYLKLLHQRKAAWNDRAHFFTFAARLMRNILMDHARARDAVKRGGDAERILLSEEIPWLDAGSDDLLELEQALRDLEQLDPAKVQLVELRFFMGCTLEETAELLGVSKTTVDRDLRFLRSWLFDRLRGAGPTPVSD